MFSQGWLKTTVQSLQTQHVVWHHTGNSSWRYNYMHQRAKWKQNMICLLIYFQCWFIEYPYIPLVRVTLWKLSLTPSIFAITVAIFLILYIYQCVSANELSGINICFLYKSSAGKVWQMTYLPWQNFTCPIGKNRSSNTPTAVYHVHSCCCWRQRRFIYT